MYAADRGAYETAVFAMRSRAGSVAVQTRALFWLSTFGFAGQPELGDRAPGDRLTVFVGNSPLYRHAVLAARAGAFKAIVAAMRAHSLVPALMFNGCSALNGLMTDSETKRAAFDAGALDVILLALRLTASSEFLSVAALPAIRLPSWSMVVQK